MARRFKLSQVALKTKDPENYKDSALAGMLYKNQIATQKNLIAVRSMRRSIADSVASADTGTDGEAQKISVAATLPSLNPKQAIRMNRTSALSGFGNNATPVRANLPMSNTQGTKFTF